MTVTTETDICKSTTEYLFRLNCLAATPIHVGSGQSSARTGSALRRNAAGKIIIPGTSIAGVVRQAIERLAGVNGPNKGCQFYSGIDRKMPCGCEVCAFMGNVSPVADAVCSQVIFQDASISAATTRVVDSVATDRLRGAASDAKKFDYAQLLPGTKINFEVRANGLTDKQFKWLATALRMLCTGRVRMGGLTNRGHGELKIDDNEKSEILMRDPADLESLLSIITKPNSDGGWKTKKRGKKKVDFANFDTNTLSPDLHLRFRITTDVRSGLLISDPVMSAKTGFGHAQRQRNGIPEIPELSFAGAFRSMAERIVRTINPNAVCDILEDPCKAKTSGNPMSLDDLCMTCRLFGNPNWASRLSLSIVEEGGGHDQPMDHVAIDRFTGGAADKKKFDSRGRRDDKFLVNLKVDRFNHSGDRDWVVGLLALLIRDLNCGYIRIGSGASKGYGHMVLDGNVESLDKTKSSDKRKTTGSTKKKKKKRKHGKKASVETDFKDFVSAFDLNQCVETFCATVKTWGSEE